MEIVVFGESLTCPAFALLLHGALRTLIDQLAATSFNVGILNISADTGSGSGDLPIVARLYAQIPEDRLSSLLAFVDKEMGIQQHQHMKGHRGCPSQHALFIVDTLHSRDTQTYG